ncbi:hypothetical protein WME98_34380 [Sorangium sp. So ce296]|uniref:hypothetical protein n=1 Tax=Sorangium sp. So ce296 TaxID=3133296 RepID=UPI003F62D2DB
MTDFKVRLEASDVPWEQLSADQKRAAERAVGLLKSFADQPSAPSRPDIFTLARSGGSSAGPWFLPWVDGVRANPVVLLDGGRGSGKSTVLLTLVHAWSEAWREKLYGDFPPRSRGELSRVHFHRANGPIPGDPRFLPLDMIDLQPIPQGTSLLLRVAGAFVRMVEYIEDRARKQDFGAEPPRSRDQWNQFVQVVASGWEPNVSARKATLDPEAYAVELGMAEQRGRDVQTSFRAFIDALLQDFMARRGDGLVPLFIVPIDDSDMNVPRSIELITLLRTIWHPRVAFVLTGFTEMFLLALRAHFLGEARRPLWHLQTTKLDLEALSEPEKPIQYAEELYNRVIPPRHRCKLDPLPRDARLQHAPPSSADARNELSIADLLGSFAVAQEPARATATGLPELSGRASLGTYFMQHRVVQLALPDRLRALEDVRLRLAEFQGQKSAAEVAHYLLGVAINHSPMLPNEEEELLRLVKIDRNEDDRSGEPPRLLVYAGQIEILWTHRLIHQVSFIPGVSLELLLPLELPRMSVNAGKTRFDLPESVTAALLLILDLIADGGGSLVGPSPLAMNPPQLVIARVESLSSSSHPPQSWPMPAWESPLDFALAANAWASTWKDKVADDFSGEAVIDAFLGVVFRVAVSDRKDGEEAKDWSAMLGKLAGSSGQSRRDKVQRDWARESLGSLLYPEAGLPSKVGDDLRGWLLAANYTDERGKPEVLWDPRRFERIRVESKSRQLADLHPGKSAVEVRVMARALCSDLDRLAGGGQSYDQRLKSLRVVQPAGSFLGTSSDDRLAKYVDDRDDLLARIQPEEALVIEKTLEPYGDQVGVSDIALIALWEALRDLHKLPQTDRVLDLEQGIIVQDLLKRRGNVVASVRTSAADIDVRLLLWTLHLDVVPPGGRRLPPALELIYRIATDVEKDETDLAAQACSESTERWPGLELRSSRDQAKRFWPAVRWEAALDREFLFRAWNHLAVGAAKELQSPSCDAGAVLESLAFQYVMTVFEIGRSRKAYAVSWSFERPDLHAWIRVIQSYFQVAADGRRWGAFCSFRSRLALLAAPEAGLPADAAERILSALNERLPESDVIQAARLSLLVLDADNDGIDDADRLLNLRNKLLVFEEIDNRHPNHPFVQRFGRRAPPQPA